MNDVGTTSLEIGVRVESEELETGTRTHTLQRVPRVRRARRRGQAETGPAADRRDRGGAAPPTRGQDPARDPDRAPRGDRRASPRCLRAWRRERPVRCPGPTGDRRRSGRAVPARGGRRARTAPAHRQDPAREPPASRRHPRRLRGRRPGARVVAAGFRDGRPGLHAVPGPDAGLHGGARGRRPGRDALGDGARRRRPVEGLAAGGRGPDHRSLGAGRPVPLADGVRGEHRVGVPAQRRAVRVAALGAAGVRRRPRGATRVRGSATR